MFLPVIESISFTGSMGHYQIPLQIFFVAKRAMVSFL